MTNMLDRTPGEREPRGGIDEKSKVSWMPTACSTIKEDEILDLVQYLLSRGRNSRVLGRGFRRLRQINHSARHGARIFEQ